MGFVYPCPENGDALWMSLFDVNHHPTNDLSQGLSFRHVEGMCIGKDPALNLVYVVVSYFVRHFEWSIANDENGISQCVENDLRFFPIVRVVEVHVLLGMSPLAVQ